MYYVFQNFFSITEGFCAEISEGLNKFYSILSLNVCWPLP